jgi:hypothetical protein
MKTILHKLMDKLGRYRLIPDRHTGAEYMHRYYLFLKNRKWFPFNITLHKIVKSDDPIFHDHPWPFFTIILKGGYWEHVPLFNKQGKKFGDFQTWHGPGSVLFRKAKDFHWLELDESVGPATTLFVMGPRQREWGFLVNKSRTKEKWVHHKNYLDNYTEYHKRYVQPMKAFSKKKS